MFLTFAFEVPPGEAALADLHSFQQLCHAEGASAPDAEARHHVVAIGRGTLKWERHAEFTTYTWDVPPGSDDRSLLLGGFTQPGALLVAIRVDVVSEPRDVAERSALLAGFVPSSLCVAEVEDGRGLVASDFRPDGEGYTRILVVDRALAPTETGALVQRLLDVEMYRALALLGLPEARRAAPEVQRIERGLQRLTQAMRESRGLAANRTLLEELSALTADLEASAAATSYRFGASRAYYQIVIERLAALGEKPVERYSGLSEFLHRRLAPALRTIETTREREAALSRKLSRATELLRTRVDIELEHQSRDLLASMERHARTQLRLQETVEGLSVAAISYYVVGLLHYLVKAAKAGGVFSLDPTITSGASVPFVVALVFVVVRGVRRRLAPDDRRLVDD